MGNQMRVIANLVAATAALVLVGAAEGQELITGANVDSVLAAAAEYGEANLVEQPNGDPLINAKVGDVGYQIFFRNCTENANCEDINFFLGFLDVKPTLEVVNEWNASKRFSRAYLDQDKDACVEMDIDLVEGVSPAYLSSQIAIWTMVVDQFADHVGYKPAS